MVQPPSNSKVNSSTNTNTRPPHRLQSRPEISPQNGISRPKYGISHADVLIGIMDIVGSHFSDKGKKVVVGVGIGK